MANKHLESLQFPGLSDTYTMTPEIASEYSSSATYAVGDYAVHSGKLYQCTTAIATAEAWTAAHWTEAKLADDVSQLKEDIADIDGISDEVKEALLDCFQHVAWIDDQGQTYYDALEHALYPRTLVSISAVFDAQGATIYTDDTLDSLKQYLTVTATYDDSSTAVVIDYTLSGTLSIGLNTITVSYEGKTTTFTVTAVGLVSLSAVFDSQGETIYTDETLDYLEQYLTVTATYSDSSTAVITNYTLSGTLVEGTSTITVSYQDKTTTFTVSNVVDWFNVWSFDYSQNELVRNDYRPATNGTVTPYRPSMGNEVISRASFWTTRGLSDSEVVVENTTTIVEPKIYPIPIPNTATKCKVTMTPSSQYFGLRLWTYNGNGSWTMGSQSGWKQGTYTMPVTPSNQQYLMINCKPASDGSIPYDGSTYPLPSLKIEYE